MAIIDLNIGLVTSEDSGKRVLTTNEVLDEIEASRCLFASKDFEVRQSDSEQTMILLVEVPGRWELCEVANEVYKLAVRLEQDAIAGRLHFGSAKAGFLLGPKAAEWGGKFIEEYYLAP